MEVQVFFAANYGKPLRCKGFLFIYLPDNGRYMTLKLLEVH